MERVRAGSWPGRGLAPSRGAGRGGLLGGAALGRRVLAPWLGALALRRVCVLLYRLRPLVRVRGSVGRALAALADTVRGRPAQLGYTMTPATWRRAARAAADADVVIAITVRALRGPLPVPVVVDHVDALSLNWARRASGPEALPVRLLAR